VNGFAAEGREEIQDLVLTQSCSVEALEKIRKLIGTVEIANFLGESVVLWVGDTLLQKRRIKGRNNQWDYDKYVDFFCC